ncbi:MAG: hypothetical protein ACJ8EH_11415 [Sphingomicrobium sp.]
MAKTKVAAVGRSDARVRNCQKRRKGPETRHQNSFDREGEAGIKEKAAEVSFWRPLAAR